MANYPLMILLKFKLLTCDFKFGTLPRKLTQLRFHYST